MLGLLAVYGFMFAGIIALGIQRECNEGKARAATKEPLSRKHVRTCIWSFHATITYYGENGRKVTSRKVAIADLARVRNSAAAKGYRLI